MDIMKIFPGIDDPPPVGCLFKIIGLLADPPK